MRSSCRQCLRWTRITRSIDLASLRADPATYYSNALARRSGLSEADIAQICTLHDERKSLQMALSDVKRKQNSIGKVAAASKASDSTKAAGRAAGVALRSKLKDVSASLAALDANLEQLTWKLPNLSHPDAPVGGYKACKTVRTTSDVAEAPPDASKDHTRVLEALQWADFAAGTSTTGPRWPFLINEGALLELALIKYALALVLRKGFKMVIAPDVVKTDLANRCGFRPRDGEASQSYLVTADGDKTSMEDGLVLAGTAEIPLAGYFADSSVEESALPQKVVALGRAFRAEAGSRGKESKGLYRVHQFSKVEMFVVCAQGQGDAALEELVGIQEELLGGLGLPLRHALCQRAGLTHLLARTLDMSTEELGASAYRKYDIEAWMPGRGSFGEVRPFVVVQL
jgi:seryl-tRNA synthetase